MSGTGDSSRFSRLGLSGTEIIDQYQNIIVEVFFVPGGSRENCEKCDI